MRILAAILLLIVSVQVQAAPAAGVSGTLSIVPGLGQVANGDTLEGLGWFTTVVGLAAVRDPYALQVALDLWMYNMYDAYRDAKPAGGKTTNYNVFQNYIAAFTPLNVVDPIGGPIVGLGALAGAKAKYPCLRYGMCPPIFGLVGMAEEGLFRGFLFPGFSDLFGSKIAGAIVSSGIFAAAHVSGGKSNLTLAPMASRFIGGMLFSLQVDRNKYDLRKAIFAHAWFDILVTDAGKIEGAQVKLPFHF